MDNIHFDINLCHEAISKIQNLVFRSIYINNCIIDILGVHFMDYGQNWTVRKHSHSFFEAHYVIRDSVHTNLNGIEYEIHANEFYLIPPGIRHSHHQKPGTSHMGFALRWQIRPERNSSKNIQMDPAVDLDKLLTSIQDISLRPVKDDGRIMQKFNHLLHNTYFHENYFSLHLLLADLFIAIMHRYTKKQDPFLQEEQPVNIPIPALENNLVSSAIRFIEDNFSQPIHAKDVSNSVYLSYSHLSRLFKKYEGRSINQYLNRVRLINAQLMLKCSGKSIRTIARETGFNSDYYFCSIFKKAYGISPMQYRKKEKNLLE